MQWVQKQFKVHLKDWAVKDGKSPMINGYVYSEDVGGKDKELFGIEVKLTFDDDMVEPDLEFKITHIESGCAVAQVFDLGVACAMVKSFAKLDWSSAKVTEVGKVAELSDDLKVQVKKILRASAGFGAA